MKRPARVYICGKPFRIVYREDMAEEAHLDYYARKIQIMADKNTSVEDIWDRLIHEIIHAISKSGSLDLNESQVSALGTELSTVFMRNEWLKQ